MNKPLRVLIVEDKADDAELVLRELKRGGYTIEWKRVETEDEMRSALETGSWDIILSDHKLPKFSSVKALTVLKEFGADIPFIIVSGSIGEDMAVAAMREGAHDYVIKGKYFRLVPAVKRELREAEVRQEKKMALEKSSQFGRIIEDSSNEVYVFNAETLNFVQVNHGARENLGYTMEELMRLTPLDIKPEYTEKSFAELIAPLRKGESELITFTTVHKRKDGSLYPVEVRLQLYTKEEPPVFVAIIQDITERKLAEEKLRMASNVMENTLEGVVITDSNAVIRYVNPATTEIIGYSREELIGGNPSIWKSNHQDRGFYQNMWSSLLKTGRWEGEIWNRRKNGEAFPSRLTISAIKDSNGVTTQYASIMHDMTEIRKSQQEIEHRAYHDTLTGLPNRLLFLDRLDQVIGRSKKDEQIFAVLFIDLDNFKNINDSMGHAVGDDMLIEVANRIASSSREADTISRLSGDEFAIIVENIELEQEAGIIALRYKEVFAKPFLHSGEELFITASIGIALYPANGNNAGEILKNADMAMYQVKKRGKDDLFYFTASLNEQVQKRVNLEKSLRRAISNDEFVVYYQPKLNIANGEIVGMEALVRWIQPDGTLVSPGDFIPVAEETGLIVAIGKMVMEKACMQTFKWQKNGYPNLRVAVNLSAKQFQQKTVISTVESALKKTALDPSLLEVEITESMVMNDMESAIETMNALRDRGIRISIDDFGTGYSSLGYLKRFPIHALKIDQSFVNDITTSADDAAIVLAIISITKSLGLKVIAEGVETNNQLDFLRKNSCDEMQGYLFSKPLPGDEFEKLLKEGQGLYRKAPPAGKTA